MRVASVLLALIALLNPWEDAAELAARGEFAEAERAYRAMLAAGESGTELDYNLGTVLLLQRRYEEARPLLLRASDARGHIGAAAAYNLGNTYLQPAAEAGRGTKRTDLLRSAIDAYKVALRLDAEDVDAKWNLELARRLLEQEETPTAGGEGGGSTSGNTSVSALQQPTPAAEPADDPVASGPTAEQLLHHAQVREAELQRERLRRPQPAGPIRP